MSSVSSDRGHDLAERMAEAARALQHQDDTQATLNSAVTLALRNVEGCDAAGISFVHQRKLIDTPAATEELVVVADRLQYELGEGPCLDAIWEEEAVYSGRLAHDQRWLRWGPGAVEKTGAKSVLAFRLFTDENTLGALNLYSRSNDGFSQDDRDDGLALAAQIAVAVAGAKQIANLNTALNSRTVIAKAIEMLMERFTIDDDRAFAVLARV